MRDLPAAVRVFDTDAPVSEGEAPVFDTDASVSEGGTPVSDTDASVSEGGTPVFNTDASVSEGGTPVFNTDAPVSEGEASVSERGALRSDRHCARINNLTFAAAPLAIIGPLPLQWQPGLAIRGFSKRG